MTARNGAERIVIVGASLAGLRTAEALRAEGFDGSITLIGDEDAEPYDRPPLSKQVLTRLAPADRTRLPRLRDLGDATWLLGVAASGLDRDRRVVRLSDGREVDYDRVVIATGVRNRTWPEADEAALEGVVGVRTSADSERLRALLERGPERVVVIGGGFTGSEIASVCRELGLAVTLVERGPAPLAGALGSVVGAIAADVQREHGVDLRTGVHVERLDGERGRVRRARLGDGTSIDADVVVVALGALRNIEWLDDARLATGPLGVSTDAGGRAIDVDGLVTDDVFAVGDVARFPHPLYGYEFVSLEHWENAVTMAQVVAHNVVCPPTQRVPHLTVPTFWSIQFGLNIKSVGIPTLADEVLVAQGSVANRSFVVAYGAQGRLVAAVTVDQAKWIDFYRAQIEQAAAFPPTFGATDGPTDAGPVPAGIPHPAHPYHGPTVVASGHHPTEMHVRPVADGRTG